MRNKKQKKAKANCTKRESNPWPAQAQLDAKLEVGSADFTTKPLVQFNDKLQTLSLEELLADREDANVYTDGMSLSTLRLRARDLYAFCSGYVGW
ncbi:hypothetical protein sscle_03g027070 [Sclerotinia sclerotiorum 1980 UF-70]|uniref:Uncharacterized protein n=1 Tax=Sclerotinia sclerotiorum (strain ATCC 18683 / 1980 / Ss-1) TaxID=665079 RepID=A0A1D9PZ22_SCLS1|nr:hypothetical protein sscle_03g027070 [Sclerotinia sclerotiorum 1980 UF-70]